MALKSSENSFRILARSGSLLANMNERRRDFELLQRFARQGEQSAFADVVRQHIDLVFGTALRKLEDPGAAREVAQNVFTALAHKAWRFAPDDSLPAWLHKTALLESKEWLRGELRRRRREQTAAELGTTMKTPDEQPAFNALVPILDEALLSLREKDRAALLLRFYESRSLRDVGTSLGVNEDTAQKRVQSALEKLSQFFRNRGFKTASVAAATAALQHTTTSASAATVGAVVNATLQAAPPAVTGLTALLARLATLSKPQVAAIAASIALVPLAWQWHENQSAKTEAQQLAVQIENTRLEQNALNGEIEQLRSTTNRLATTLVKLTEQVERTTRETRAFEAWKKQTRQVLLADDYRRPDDSAFVRIPKSALNSIDMGIAAMPPGIIAPAARELLGLSMAEREGAELSLSDYFGTQNRLIEASVYETNRPPNELPDSVVASKTLVMPALGEEGRANVKNFSAKVLQAIGKGREGMVDLDPEAEAPDDPLNLKAAVELQEVVALIYERNEQGGPEVVFQWHRGKGMTSSAGVPLAGFLSGADEETAKAATLDLEVQFFPQVVTARFREWLKQQAEKLVGQEAKR